MKNYIFVAIFAVLIVFVGLLGFRYYLNEPETLNSPILKNLNNKYSSNVELSGTGYPKAKVLFFINNKYVDDVVVDENGTFSKNIKFTEDGKKLINAKQIYKNITSNFGDENSFIIDITPPDSSTFKLTKELPATSKNKEIGIIGFASPKDILLINGGQYKIGDNGEFNINYTLDEGNNNIEFALEDDIGNKTTVIDKKSILVDSIPPAISSFIDMAKAPTEESVVIDIGTWQGYLDSTNSVPITGYIKGNVKKVTLDGKNINWDENNKIYQRLNLYIYGGLNKYKVVAEDMAGNISNGYVETTAERNKDEINVNLNNE